MSILELFFYLAFINWSTVSCLYFVVKNDERLFLVEMYWVMGIPFLALCAMLIEALLEDPSFNLRQVLVNALVLLWGIKLSWYFYKRKKENVKGSVYLHIEVKSGSGEGLKNYQRIFLTMGLIQIIAIAPLLSLNYLPGPSSLNPLDAFGFILFFLGFYVETKSDKELLNFRLDGPSKANVLNSGLWSYTRHPNYFGHILQWWALYIIACNSVVGVWSFYGPLVMSLFILRAPIKNIEKTMLAEFRDYERYINTTNKLIPDFLQNSNRFSDLVLFLTPHKQITSFAGLISKSENRLLKNFLIRSFSFFYEPDLEESTYQEIKDFPSFNDFFTRKLKPSARKISPSKHKVISPVDGTIVSLGQIKKETLVQAKKIRYGLHELLEDKSLEKYFKNGWYVTIYLAPSNYHRIHFPLNGIIKKTKYLKGNLYSVNQKSSQKIRSLYSKNERTLTFIQSELISYGLVSVGATLVGSIVPFWNEGINSKKQKIVDSWNEGPNPELAVIKKGQELGYFQLGSTVILLFPKNVSLDNNFLYESKPVKFGEELLDLSKLSN